MRPRPKELGRRLVIAVLLVAVPVLASSSDVLGAHARAAAMKVVALTKWGESAGEVLGASAIFLFSVACCVAAAFAIGLSVKSVLMGRSDGLERPHMALRALVLLHGAVSPFLALSATQHLSPTVRGRLVLARYFSVVLEHQAFLAFATASVATAWAVMSVRAGQVREVNARVRAARSLIAGYVVCGVASRVLAGTLVRGAAGASVASELELELALALTATTIAVLTASLLAARASPSAPVVSEEGGSAPPKPLAAVPRTLSTLLLPLFSMTVAAWASSRPCDPDPDELAHVPTVPSAAMRPLPLARAGAESTSEQGVLLADASKRLHDVWPRHAGAREIRLVVQRERFDRGHTGIFARFGDGRFGVLRILFADRDSIPTCAAAANRKCVEVAPGAVQASVAALQSSAGPPFFVYRAAADETVGDLAHDAAALLAATYDSARTTALDLDVDLLVSFPAPPPAPSKPTRSAPSPRPPSPPRADDESLVAPSPGCAAAHPAVSFEAHDLPSGGSARRLFVSAPAASEGARSLVVVLHGDGGSAEGIRRSLPLESRLGATSVVVYPEARASHWDVDAPMASSPDVAFVRDAVTWVLATFCVDQHRRLVTGFSSGGYLANALACDGDFRAVVAHAAWGPGPVDDELDTPSGLLRCKPAAALVLQGDGDREVMVDAATRSAERWRVTDRCAPSAAGASGACEVFGACDRPVERCIVPGLGHALASDAAARTADFFERAQTSTH